MFKYEKNTVRDLPKIPFGSEFMLGSKYAQVINGILYLHNNEKWVCTGKTLDVYNSYYEKEKHEYDIYECLSELFGSTIGEKGENLYFFVDGLKQNKVIGTYNKPVKKGQKLVDGVMVDVIKCGERFECTHNLPQLSKWLGNRKQYSVYEFEDEMRLEFEREVVHLFGWIEENRAYVDVATQAKFKEFVAKRFNQISEIKIVIKG